MQRLQRACMTVQCGHSALYNSLRGYLDKPPGCLDGFINSTANLLNIHRTQASMWFKK